MARLYVLSGVDVGRTLDFESFASVGRIKACDLALRDPSISRRHAHLQLEGGQWELIDDDSRNGITIGGERQRRAVLSDGQEFRLGEVLLRFRNEVAAVDALVPVSAPAPKASEFARTTFTPAPVRPAPADSGLEIEDADEIDLAASGDLGRTNIARAVGSPAALNERARADFKQPAGVGLEEQRGRILQYHRTQDSKSLLSFEFEQLPLWQRALLGMAALALLAGMAWAAFFGSTFLRDRLGGSPPAAGAPHADE